MTGSVDIDSLAERLIVRLTKLIPGLNRWYQTPGGRKKVRYALVSVVALPIGTLAVASFNLIGFSAGWSAFFGSSVGAIPSYFLNRYWVWSMTGKNRVMKEILPFWAITLPGIGLALFVGHDAGRFTRDHDIVGLTRLVVLLATNIGAFGIFWVAKYILFNKAVFIVRRAT